MAYLYLIGQPDGPVFVGTGRKPDKLIERQIVRLRRDLIMRGMWDCGPEAGAEMALRIAQAAFTEAEAGHDDGWWMINHDEAIAICTHAADLVNLGTDPPAHAAIMTRLREEVFKTTQSQFAAIAGVSNSQVSRWESGDQEPSWRALARLRLFAMAAHFPWSDADLFGLPRKPERPTGTVVNLNRARGAK